MSSIISVSNLSKTYKSGFQALKNVNLEIREREIFALLGPNGAGKTTLISIICGIVNASEGSVTVAGHDIVRDYRKTRAMIGLVPQELTTEIFETVWATASYSRGLFGKPANPDHIDQGAEGPLAVRPQGQPHPHAVGRHEAPRADRQGARRTSRRSCSSTNRRRAWTSSCARTCGRWCARLRDSGVTIILTTHYIDEAEEIGRPHRRDQSRRADPGREQATS